MAMSSMSRPQPSSHASPSTKHLRRRPLAIAFLFVIANLLHWNNVLISSYSSLSSSMSSSGEATRTKVPLATVAYAISITSCASKLSSSLFDAASVLRQSIVLNSWPLHPTSQYEAKFYAFTLKPPGSLTAEEIARLSQDECSRILTLAGWEVLPQSRPVHPELIKEPEGSILKKDIGSDGCCGDAELIKLSTYKLLDYDMAVHLDLDTLVIHPLDELFNVMHFNYQCNAGREARIRLVDEGLVASTYLNRRVTGNPSSSSSNNANGDDATTAILSKEHNDTAIHHKLLVNITVNAFFTKDYNMIVPGPQQQRVGVQGGFLLIRPSITTYLELINTVYSGEFYSGFNAQSTGWYQSGYGRHIWGSMTIQGLLAYYFDMIDVEHSVELNRCRYNNIADNARTSTFATNAKFPRGTLLPFVRNASNPRYNFDDGTCRDGREECGDVNCQRFPISKARILHYTYCKSPWKCNDCTYLETYKEPMCYAMTREWFRARRSLPGEETISTINLLRAGVGDGSENGPVSIIREDGEVDVIDGNCYKEFYLGYCLDQGAYVPISHRNFSSIIA